MSKSARGASRQFRSQLGGGCLAALTLIFSQSAFAQEVVPSSLPPPEPPVATSAVGASPVDPPPVTSPVEQPGAAAFDANAALPAADPNLSFGDPFAGAAAAPMDDDQGLVIKMYGDTQFSVRDHAETKDTFSAAHLDLFATANVGRLTFLSEVFFEASTNEMEFDLERMQVSYLVSNYLRLRAGRSHTAFGYYNDTYHHGNLFELTTSRPFSVQFEDNGGLFAAHLVGAGADGTFDVPHGSFRYDLEVGNGRLADLTQVAIVQAGKSGKMGNLRLRYVHDSGLTVGVNAVSDLFPSQSTADGNVMVPKVREQIFGAHAAYMERRWHVLFETALIRHDSSGRSVDLTYSGFLELGHEFGDWTPYGRAELIRFPSRGDLVFQGQHSIYGNTETLFDPRIGLRWRPVPQIAMRIEGDRPAFDKRHYEVVTLKLAFGF
jgi:hypothetical protein